MRRTRQYRFEPTRPRPRDTHKEPPRKPNTHCVDLDLPTPRCVDLDLRIPRCVDFRDVLPRGRSLGHSPSNGDDLSGSGGLRQLRRLRRRVPMGTRWRISLTRTSSKLWFSYAWLVSSERSLCGRTCFACTRLLRRPKRFFKEPASTSDILSAVPRASSMFLVMLFFPPSDSYASSWKMSCESSLCCLHAVSAPIQDVLWDNGIHRRTSENRPCRPDPDDLASGLGT